MEEKESHNFLGKNRWTIILLIFSAPGIVFSVWGFSIGNNCKILSSFYDTFQLFILHHTFAEGMPWQLEVGRWLIFAAFLWLSFRLFFEILAPEFIKTQVIKCFYRNHIVICGLNKITINLIEKFDKEKIIVLTEETNQYAETLKTRGKKLLIGDFADESFWYKAKLKEAGKLYAIIDDEKINIKIAQSVFSYLEKSKRDNDALKCFTLIKDRELKTILEESALFKYKTDFFDGILFNISEMGIKYGIGMNIDHILSAKMGTAPEILLVGMTEKTEIALLNLVHCLTMKGESFRFTIAEENPEKISLFEKRCEKLHLRDFAEIGVSDSRLEKICTDKTFDSILVCVENQTDAIKKAVEIRYLLGKNEPNIVVFCNDSDTFNKILNTEGKLNEKGEKEIFPLKDRNIFLINLMEEIAGYVFVLDTFIEKKAIMAHDFWNKLYGEKKEYDKMSGHFRQTNRNQILDNFLRTFIATGKSFSVAQEHLVSFADSDREILAMMEHRRWMIEKYENGWQTGKRIKPDEFKRHDCLIMWNELPENQKKKDFDAIDLMVHLINSPQK